MGARGELFTTQVLLEGRAYFFNVKENRSGDIFLQIVESKSRDGADFDRHQVAIFAEDMQQFLQGLDKSLSFIDKERIERMRQKRGKASEKNIKDSQTRKSERAHIASIPSAEEKDVGRAEERERAQSGVKKTGKVIRVVSKRENL